MTFASRSASGEAPGLSNPRDGFESRTRYIVEHLRVPPLWSRGWTWRDAVRDMVDGHDFEKLRGEVTTPNRASG